MAINIPIISDFTDKGIKDAKIAFQNFKTSVSNAEGVMGKFKAGGTAALDYVKANAQTFALAAGGAIATFAVNGMNAFKDLAIEADKFAAATGLAVEDSSRWLEVAGDLGIDSGKIETAIGKMNRELGNNPGLLRQLGDDVIYAQDGTLNANETFLHLIDRLKGIKDPAERAKEGARIFGRGWQDMAVLVETGSDKLRASLGAVSEQKVINQEEVDKAKRLRDALDNLKDKGEDLALSLGQNVIPFLEKLVWLLDQLAISSRGAGGVMELTTEQLANEGVEAAKVQLAFEKNQAAMKGYYESRVAYYEQTNGLTGQETDSLNDQRDALWELNDAWKALLGELDLANQFRDVEDAIKKANDAAVAAFNDPTKFNAFKDDQDAVIKKFADIMSAMKLTSDEQNRIRFLVDTAPLEYALEALRKLDLVKTGQITPNLSRVGNRAAGGPMSANAPYLVGENGPEIFYPRTNGTMANAGTTGANITVNVNGADPNSVVRVLQQYVRSQGPVPVNTRTM